MNTIFKFAAAISLLVFLNSCATKEIIKEEEEEKQVEQLEEMEEIPGEEIAEIIPMLKTEAFPIIFPAVANIENVLVDKRHKSVNINLIKEF